MQQGRQKDQHCYRRTTHLKACQRLGHRLVCRDKATKRGKEAEASQKKHEHSPYDHADGACLRHMAGCFLVVAYTLWLMSCLSDRSA